MFWKQQNCVLVSEKDMQCKSVFGYKVKQFFLGFEERLYAKKDGETYR